LVLTDLDAVLESMALACVTDRKAAPPSPGPALNGS
jgi:hypothetical protein